MPSVEGEPLPPPLLEPLPPPLLQPQSVVLLLTWPLLFFITQQPEKSIIFARGPQPEKESPCFDKQQILELFQNCIKLASEKKINQKNTWDLNLIDHLCEIIKVEDENNAETNFQKASCTLEAGVKIYSMRVDSVHSEAYKVLGGITLAGQDDSGDNEDAGGAVTETNQKKQPEKKLWRKYYLFTTWGPPKYKLRLKELKRCHHFHLLDYYMSLSSCTTSPLMQLSMCDDTP